MALSNKKQHAFELNSSILLDNSLAAIPLFSSSHSHNLRQRLSRLAKALECERSFQLCLQSSPSAENLPYTVTSTFTRTCRLHVHTVNFEVAATQM